IEDIDDLPGAATEADQARQPPALAVDPQRDARRPPAGGNDEIGPGWNENVGPALAQSDQAGPERPLPSLQPGVQARPQGIEPQLLDLIGPAQSLRETHRLGGVAGLVIGQHPDHRRLAQRTAALMQADERPAEARDSLQREVPAHGRMPLARPF